MSITRIGLLALHWGMFDAVMPPQYRQEKEALARQVAETLAQLGEVVYPGLVLDDASGKAAGRTFESQQVDVVVVFPCMAAPPSYAWETLRELKRAPVVIWNAHHLEEIPEDFNAADLVRHSTNVGSTMLTNVLLREGRTFRMVTGLWENEGAKQEVVRLVQAAAVASRLRRARLGAIGGTIPGYLNLAVDRADLKRDLGLEVIDISSEDLTESYQSVPAAREQDLLMEMRAWKIEGLTEADQRKAARLAAALDALVEAHRLDGGTVNCRSPFFLQNPQIGIVACYAVSRLLQRGVPFTCTGDIPAAIASLILKLLGAPAQWCECNVIDYRNDFMLLTDTGEGDPAIAENPGDIEVIPNQRFAKGGCGACLRFRFKAGPATLVGFSQQESDPSGWCLTIAPGEIVAKHFPAIGVPNAGFRFRKPNVAEQFNRWCFGGTTHHGVVTSGDFSPSLGDIADFLGIKKWVV